MTASTHKKGDIITYGAFPQHTSVPEPLNWEVLDAQNGRLLLISCACLMKVPFHAVLENCTWESSDVRRWLNQVFFAEAFSTSEQTRIADTVLASAPNPEYGTDSGAQTIDKVFLLSAEEAYQYFKNFESRKAAATNYAKQSSTVDNAVHHGDCWWTRTTGRDRLTAAYVYGCGAINNNGAEIADGGIYIRPVISLYAETKEESLPIHWKQTKTVSIEQMETAEKGDHVRFGEYQQSASAGKEPIDWTVLDVRPEGWLVISSFVLEPMAVQDPSVFDREHTTWGNCSMRKWLNEVFYQTAFSDEERAQILRTHVKNLPNPEFKTDCGPDTEDFVFLLSVQEADQYFEDNEARRNVPTPYAVAQGAFTYPGERLAGLTESWTRTMGQTPRTSAFIYTHGGIELSGYSNSDEATGCRPALVIARKEPK